MRNIFLILFIVTFKFDGDCQLILTDSFHMSKAPFEQLFQQDKLLSKYFILSEKDSFQINYTSSGCFHYREEKIIIRRINSDSIAFEFFADDSENSAYYTSNFLRKKVTVIKGNEFLENLIELEQTGKTLNPQYSTTSSVLKLKSGKYISYIFNRGYNWNGYHDLIHRAKIYGNKAKNETTTIESKRFLGNIFLANYPLNFSITNFKYTDRLTPSIAQIKFAEKLLRRKNKLIRQESKFYHRQYLGFKDSAENSFVLINLIRGFKNTEWTTYRKNTFMLGCKLSNNRYQGIKQVLVNLNTKELLIPILEIENCM